MVSQDIKRQENRSFKATIGLIRHDQRKCKNEAHVGLNCVFEVCVCVCVSLRRLQIETVNMKQEVDSDPTGSSN